MKKLLIIIFVLVTANVWAVKPQETQTITLMLDWFINPNHGPIIIAKQKGFFKEEGLEVKIEEPADPSLPPKLVSTGQVDVAVYYQNSLIDSVAYGLPIAWVGTLISSSLDGLIVLDNGKIPTLQALKGKKIGVSSSLDHKSFLKQMFKQQGLSYEDVQFVNVGWNLTSSLLSGQVDAILGAYRNFELNEIQLAGYKGKMFFYEEHGVPPYDELIFIAAKNTKKETSIIKLLQAVEKGTQFIINHPEQAWEVFYQYNAKQLKNKLNKKAWFDTIAYFAKRPAAVDFNRYQRMIDFFYKNKEIKKRLSASELILTFGKNKP